MTISSHRAPGVGRRLRRRRSIRAGFTLVELTLSLVAGLLVAMAVMGVSKEATNTFHEEVRVSGAEMGLRVAMERVRLDLQRAAYMGTGNILGDPLIAHLANYVAGGGNPPTNLSNFTGGTLPYSLLNLSGVTAYPAGLTPKGQIAVPATVEQDAAAQALLTLQPTVLAPDSLDIAGNMSSADEYAAAIVWSPANAPASCSQTAAIQLQMTTPAGWRIRNAETLANASGQAWGAALQAIFHPGLSTSSSFLLRVTDQSGRYQYLVGCAGAANSAIYAPGATATVLPTATVFLSPSSTLLNSNATGGLGGIGGFAAGLVVVSPLEITRWSIQSAKQVTAAATTAGATYFYNQTAAAYTDPSEFLLTRSYVDVSAACGAGAPCPVDVFTTEVIAEYAVDLKLGLTVDAFPNNVNCAATQTTPSCCSFPCPTIAPTYNANPLQIIPMDAPAMNFQGLGAVEGSYVLNGGPERIRDVQVRIGTRSPFGDRALNLPVPQDTAIPTGYMYRYLMDGTSSRFQSGTPYARVREATTEVNLPNQARFYW